MGMPTPVSCTERITPSPADSTATVMSPPGGVNFTAVVNRVGEHQPRAIGVGHDWGQLRWQQDGELQCSSLGLSVQAVHQRNH